MDLDNEACYQIRFLFVNVIRRVSSLNTVSPYLVDSFHRQWVFMDAWQFQVSQHCFQQWLQAGPIVFSVSHKTCRSFLCAGPFRIHMLRSFDKQVRSDPWKSHRVHWQVDSIWIEPMSIVSAQWIGPYSSSERKVLSLLYTGVFMVWRSDLSAQIHVQRWRRYTSFSGIYFVNNCFFSFYYSLAALVGLSIAFL